ncbi:MAG: lipopolysaccharide biosynthesis protein, partial [Pedobacter sp.]
MSVTEAKRKKGLDEVDIRLSDIVYFLTSNRRRILLGIIIGLIIGALYAFSKPNVYTTQVSVLPEAQATGASGLGSLGSLAGLAGINLNNIAGQDAIRPDLYPNVLQSVPFALDLLKQPVYLQGSLVKISLQEFMNRQASGFLGGLFKRSSNTDDSKKTSNLKNFSQAIQVTKEQEDLIKAIQESVSAIYDKKTGKFKSYK